MATYLGYVHRDRRLLVAVGLVGLISAGLFLAIKSDARDRLFQTIPISAGTTPSVKAGEADAAPKTALHAGEITTDDRLRIYQDTMHLIGNAPWTGTGLGTFSLVFPFYRQASVNAVLMLHPESDWLMVAAEMGLPALFCLGLLILLVLRQWHPEREHPYWPLRWGILVAAGAAVLHGFVDVPSHRAALGWWILTLAGLALQPGRTHTHLPQSGKAARATRLLFLLAGLASLALGTQLVRAEWFSGSALPPFAAKHAQAEILRTFNLGNNDLALEQARRAVQVSPLVSPLYYQLGVLALRFEDTDAEVDRAFLVQRLLDPFPPAVPQIQGIAWLPVDATRAAALLTGALARMEKLPATSAYKRAALPYFKDLVEQAGGMPAAQRLLWKTAADRGPEWMLAWLEVSVPGVAKERLGELAADEKFLAQLDSSQRQRFLAAWSGKGDRDALQAFLTAHGAGWATGK